MQDFVAAFTSMWTTQTYKETEWTRARRVGTWPSEGGGCLNMDSWVTNPQLFLDVPPGAANASVVIVLTQADEKLHRGSTDSARKAIGVLVQKFHWGNDNLRVKRMSTVARTEVVTCTQPFAPQREIITRLELSAGKYVIVPMTYSPRTGGRYWVTVLSTAKVSDGAIACATRTAGVDMCVCPARLRARARDAQISLFDESEVVFEDATLPASGTSEMEHDITEMPAAELEDIDLEPEHESHALASLATLISELWETARKLEAEKASLQSRLAVLEEAA